VNVLNAKSQGSVPMDLSYGGISKKVLNFYRVNVVSGLKEKFSESLSI